MVNYHWLLTVVNFLYDSSEFGKLISVFWTLILYTWYRSVHECYKSFKFSFFGNCFMDSRSCKSSPIWNIQACVIYQTQLSEVTLIFDNAIASCRVQRSRPQSSKSFLQVFSFWSIVLHKEGFHLIAATAIKLYYMPYYPLQSSLPLCHDKMICIILWPNALLENLCSPFPAYSILAVDL